jgi:hypothetical protein
MELCNALEVTDRQPLIYEYCHKTVIVHDRNHINLTASCVLWKTMLWVRRYARNRRPNPETLGTETP